jgi:hypothetical protein
MNTPQVDSVYVSADLVTASKQQENSQQIIISDVFDIPSDFDVVKPATPPTNPIAVNFIKSINHNAMTDVMNQHIGMIKEKTPSISTKQTDISVPIQVPAPPAMIRAVSSSVASSVVASQQPTASRGLATVTTKKNTKPRNTINNKVIIEEEDKDSAIDYDDDDPEIKKTKLSLFHFAKDITFNLIFAIPFLQKARLNAMLKDPTLAINQIERIFDEFKDQMTQFELESIKKYVCEDGIRDQLNYILESGFNKILSDGIIDINDAPQFNQLVYYIIKSFNDINHGKVYRFFISREHVMLLLHFVLKSVFTLTLKGQEEQMAIGLLDTSFKLVQLEVLPIVSKRWYHKFRICKSAKQIEDIIE